VAKVTVDVHADIAGGELDADGTQVAAEPARAIARVIGDAIRHSDVPASPSTIRRRRARGITSTRKWNATGELAASIVARQRGDGFAIGVAADRLEDPRLLEELEDDLRVLADPTSNPRVIAAIESTVDELLKEK
jgi:hypothetical protein